MCEIEVQGVSFAGYELAEYVSGRNAACNCEGIHIGIVESLVTNAHCGKCLRMRVLVAVLEGPLGSPVHMEIVTWLILPVVICLSQRLSHACLSINKFVL